MTLGIEVRPSSPYNSRNRFDVFADEHRFVAPRDESPDRQRPATASGIERSWQPLLPQHNAQRENVKLAPKSPDDVRRFSFPNVPGIKPLAELGPERVIASSSAKESSPALPRYNKSPTAQHGQSHQRHHSQQQPQLHQRSAASPAMRKALSPARPTFDTSVAAYRPLSLWDYLRVELAATDTDEAQDYKHERVRNFLTLPAALERTLAFGFVVCLDAFFYTVTILPLRFARSTGHLLYRIVQRRPSLKSSEKVDLLRGAIIIVTCAIVQQLDASRIYHVIRGQAAVKLYVLYNVLEIADKLLSALGQDILDVLCSKSTFGKKEDGSQRHMRPLAFLLLAIIYNVLHTVLLLWELVTLNVTVNSFSNALMTLLLSNQIVEIKGSVFKKFEKEGLFQITCADMVERFQLFIMLIIIGLRNTFEIAPESWIETIQTSLGPLAMVLGSEMLVDWLKHCFITKFNHVRPAIYGRFIDVLCRDYVKSASSASNTYVDQSPAISRRIGLPVMPLICLCVRSATQILAMLAAAAAAARSSSFVPFETGTEARQGDFEAVLIRSIVTVLIGLLVFATLTVCKLSLGVGIIRYAHARYYDRTSAQMPSSAQPSAGHAMMTAGELEERRWEKERQRAPIYQGVVEVDGATKAILNHDTDNLLAQTGRNKGLFGLERYSMISKRIW